MQTPTDTHTHTSVWVFSGWQLRRPINTCLVSEGPGWFTRKRVASRRGRCQQSAAARAETESVAYKWKHPMAKDTGIFSPTARVILIRLGFFSETMDLVPFPPLSGMCAMLREGTLRSLKSEGSPWTRMTIDLPLVLVSLTLSIFSSLHPFYLFVSHLSIRPVISSSLTLYLPLCVLSPPGLPSQLSSKEAANGAGDLWSRSERLHWAGVRPTPAHIRK